MEEDKPKFRGRIHQAAFYITLLITIAYIISWCFSHGNLGISVYLISQLVLFGVSSTYHTTTWKSERMEYFFRCLDHVSIFILISGTQTSVALTLLPRNKYTKSILTLTWSISIAGILKILLLQRLDHIFDLCVYILHGISIVPFFKILIDNLSYFDLALFILGGSIYITGGIIYGVRKPDPLPYIFGYHEVFHVFTLLANYCFFIPLLKNYIKCFGLSHPFA